MRAYAALPKIGVRNAESWIRVCIYSPPYVALSDVRVRTQPSITYIGRPDDPPGFPAAPLSYVPTLE